MKIHRFITQYKIAGDRVACDDDEVVHQVKNVLKIHHGEQVIFCNGRNQDVLAEVSDIGKKEIVGKVIEIADNEERGAMVKLYCSIIKRDNFELMTQKVTELGVAEIIPVISERTIKKDLNIERLKKIAKEAAELSGRSVVPIIHEPLKLREALDACSENVINYVCEKTDKYNPQPHLEKEGRVSVGVYVGPEGGWTEKELEDFRGLKVGKIGLGRNVLRAETAAIVAVYKLLNS